MFLSIELRCKRLLRLVNERHSSWLKRRELISKRDNSQPHEATHRKEKALINYSNAGSTKMVYELGLLFKEKGWTVDVYRHSGETPLLLAISQGNVATVVELLRVGARAEGIKCFNGYVNPKHNQRSQDPLLFAVQCGLSAKAVNAIARRYSNIDGIEAAIALAKASPGPYDADEEQLIAVVGLLLDNVKRLGDQVNHQGADIYHLQQRSHN